MARLAGELGYSATAETMRARVKVLLGSASDRVFVAVDAAGEIAGWLQAHAAHNMESGFRVEITGLIVATSARRRGIGRALAEKAEQWAKELGAEAVVVRSNSKRVESHSFYPALGYEPIKTQVVYRKSLAYFDGKRQLQSVAVGRPKRSMLL
jgi:GNAT superfamily N-acetyltransferase